MGLPNYHFRGFIPSYTQQPWFFIGLAKGEKITTYLLIIRTKHPEPLLGIPGLTPPKKTQHSPSIGKGINQKKTQPHSSQTHMYETRSLIWPGPLRWILACVKLRWLLACLQRGGSWGINDPPNSWTATSWLNQWLTFKQAYLLGKIKSKKSKLLLELRMTWKLKHLFFQDFWFLFASPW